MKNHFYYLCVLLFVIIGISALLNIESFTTQSSKSFYGDVANVDESVKGLYPTRKLGQICKDKGGYPPAYMPTQCIHQDGSVNKHANCECMDKTMTYCTSCYPDVKHIELNAEDLEHEYSYMSYNK